MNAAMALVIIFFVKIFITVRYYLIIPITTSTPSDALWTPGDPSRKQPADSRWTCSGFPWFVQAAWDCQCVCCFLCPLLMFCSFSYHKVTRQKFCTTKNDLRISPRKSLIINADWKFFFCSPDQKFCKPIFQASPAGKSTDSYHSPSVLTYAWYQHSDYSVSAGWCRPWYPFLSDR